MSNEQLIKRLQEESASLQKQLKQITSEFKKLVSFCDNLEAETSAARKLIWAAAHANKGRIEIPDASMVFASGDGAIIKTFYEEAERLTIICAETEIKEKKKD
jgi:hypothetical protein